MRKFLTKGNLIVSALVLALFAGSVTAGYVPDAGTIMTMGGLGVTSLAGRRIVDPVLTNVALGYSNEDYVGDALFPEVPVSSRAGKVIKFDKDTLKNTMKDRAPGEKRATARYGYGSESYAIVQGAEDVVVTREEAEEAMTTVMIDLAMQGVEIEMEKASLYIELKQAKKARASANYATGNKITVASANRWNAADADPLQQIKTAREVIRAKTGRYPNVCVMSAVAFEAFIGNANVIDRFKHTNGKSITQDMVAELIQVKSLKVGTGIEVKANGDNEDIWGKDVILAHSMISSNRGSKKTPSFGYSYVLNGYPMIEKGEWDASISSTVYPCTVEKEPLITDNTAGYLFKNVIA